MFFPFRFCPGDALLSYNRPKVLSSYLLID